MLGIHRQGQMDKVKTALREAISYTDEIARNERLRDDLRAAREHGAEARDRIKKDFAANDIATRLANDRTQHKNVRAILDDLDSAGDRIRRNRSRRVRNSVLVLAV